MGTSRTKAAPVDEAKVTAEEQKEARLAAITEARTQALSELRVKYRDELNARIKELAKAKGFEWKPAPTEAEKAAAKIRELLAANPELNVAALASETGSDEG